MSEDQLFADGDPDAWTPSGSRAENATAALFARLGDEQAAPPWSWTELPGDEAAALMDLLAAFVEDYNLRYAWAPGQLIPPCWPAHGSILEELTTLWWSRYLAFDAPGARIADAQAWHDRWLPGFLQRLPGWMEGTRPTCTTGKHDDPAIWPAQSQAAADLSPEARVLTRRIAAAELRAAPKRPGPRRPST
ncbi:hypothetical protein GCM10009839_86370 [Catenulispora yoronensis]|uniref:DUF4913 domain-containing protein n=1 Tax=Catenulispora yoronensis TaxID=450799 RepID=A0ABN2VGQ3_9ACTN